MERMIEPRAPAAARPTLAARFAAFVAERFPFALERAIEGFRIRLPRRPGARRRRDRVAAPAAAEALARATATARRPRGFPRRRRGVAAAERLRQARAELLEACDGFLAREAIAASLTREERLEILRGMILTRAIDNRLKAFFSGSEVRYRDAAFQGKGFRSLGQEAIYAAPIRLRRGAALPRPGRLVAGRRRRAADPRPRRRARDAARRRDRAHGR